MITREVQAERDGFPCYAPELAKSVSGYDASWFETLGRVQGTYFWFVARTKLVLDVIKSSARSSERVLEVGCGTGHVLRAIGEAYPRAALTGSEVLTDGLAFTRGNVPSAELIQADICNLPFASHFDIVLALDVIEHVERDDAALASIFTALAPGGIVVLTVPQHRFMWSTADELAGHVRRYTRAELQRRVSEQGFQIIRLTSFVTLLFPLMLAARLKSRIVRDKSYDVRDEITLGDGINRIFLKVMAFELALLRTGVSLPFGGSLLCVARRP